MKANGERPIQLVSVDDHVVEPPTLWIDRLPQRYSDVWPRVRRERMNVIGDEAWADVWYYEDSCEALVRGSHVAGLPPEDDDRQVTNYDEMRTGCYSVEERLLDMDRDNVEVSLCFPNQFVRFCGQRFLLAKDKDLALLCVQAYNDWGLEEWMAPSDGRLHLSGIVPLWDAQLAADEVFRLASRGITSICFSEIPARLGLPTMYSGHWEPLFAACADTGTVINLHIGSSSAIHTTSEDAPLGVRISNHYGNSSFSLSDWILSRAFIRYPSLKVAFSEGQAGWIPYLMSRLDGLWRAGYKVNQVRQLLPELPSTYVRDHVYACVFDDPVALRVLDMIGEDNICFETDYPHCDGSFPHSAETAALQTAGLTDEQRMKVLRTNAARLYRFERVLAEQPVRAGAR